MKIEAIAGMSAPAREKAKVIIQAALDGLKRDVVTDKGMFGQHRMKAYETIMQYELQLLFLGQKESVMEAAIESQRLARAAKSMFVYLCDLGGEHEEYGKKCMKQE